MYTLNTSSQVLHREANNQVPNTIAEVLGKIERKVPQKAQGKRGTQHRDSINSNQAVRKTNH